MLGFGGLAAQSGLPMNIAVTMTALIWALPSQVVLVGAMAGGLSIVAAAIAVSLSAVRLLPMTVALMPLLNAGRPSRLSLLAASHFMAVTPWVAAMRQMGDLPVQGRVWWFLGMGATLSATNTLATIVGFWGGSNLPPALSAGLVFLMPVYFLVSLTLAAKVRADYLALLFGLVATPLATIWFPEADLLIGGVGAGTLAYVIHRLTKARVA
jgi:predicted branched-subunit amino acid permease